MASLTIGGVQANLHNSFEGKERDEEGEVRNVQQKKKVAKASDEVSSTQRGEVNQNNIVQTPGEKAKKFLDDTELCLALAKEGLSETKLEEKVSDAFEQIQKDGVKMIRRGTLGSIQAEILSARKSQRSLLKSARDARKITEEVDFAVDNALRRVTIANTVVNRLNERCARTRRSTFTQGSTEFKNWTALKAHTNAVMQNIRKKKFAKEVEEIKTMLDKGTEKVSDIQTYNQKEGLKEYQDSEDVRRITL